MKCDSQLMRILSSEVAVSLALFDNAGRLWRATIWPEEHAKHTSQVFPRMLQKRQAAPRPLTMTASTCDRVKISSV